MDYNDIKRNIKLLIQTSLALFTVQRFLSALAVNNLDKDFLSGSLLKKPFDVWRWLCWLVTQHWLDQIIL